MRITDPKSYRLEHRLTLAQVAKKLGISAGMVSMLENGKRRPSAAVAEKYRKLTRGKVRLQDFPGV